MRGSSQVTLMLALKKRMPKQHRKALVQFTLLLLALFTVYSIIFQFIMHYEGRDYSIISGFYWTLVVMSTMGFGDIVFVSDLGRLFSMIVNMTGLVVLIVLLPYVIIEFVYNPLSIAQKEASAPRQLPETYTGHVLIARHDAIAEALITRLQQHHIPYAVVVENSDEAYKFSDIGVSVLVGNLNQSDIVENARMQDAALLVVNTNSDPINTSIVFGARQSCEQLPIVSMANHYDAIDILELAGSTEVLDVGTMMGQALARCTSVGGSTAHIMSEVDKLLIVEARAAQTALVGQTLRELDLGKNYNITVVGIWERGKFELAGPQTRISENSILVMGVSQEQLDTYNANFGKIAPSISGAVIIGAGSVGLSTANALKERHIPFTIIEKDDNKHYDEDYEHNILFGDATDIKFLKSTPFFEASSIIITTNDDDVNIFLTLYYRKLRPDVQILSRANHERTVSALHHAGVDFVLSSSTMASIALFNHLHQGRFYTMVEGLFAKKVLAPPSMVGNSLVKLQFRVLTGSSVIAMETQGEFKINPSPFDPIPEGAQLIMILTPEAEQRFIKHFLEPKEEQ